MSSPKQIFCEKPLDLSLERVQEVLDIVKKTGVKLMLGFNRRFDPEFKKIRQLVENGAIGEPQIVKITSRDPGPPPVSYIKVSGGMFLDMTIHDFDMARYIAGKQVKEVFAKAAVKVDPEIGEGSNGNFDILYNLKENLAFILRTNFLNMESTFRNKYYSKKIIEVMLEFK